jgi:hypothetical protein
MARNSSVGVTAQVCDKEWNGTYICIGFEDSEKCNNAWIAWVYDAETSRTAIYTTAVQTSIFVTIETHGDGETYTDCDDIPRFRFRDSPITTTTRTISMVRETTLWTFSPLSYLYTGCSPSSQYCGQLSHRPVPHCSPAPQFCSRLNYDFIRDLMVSATKDPDPPVLARPFREACDRAPPFENSGAECNLYAEAEVMLFYWPPDLVSRNICAADGYGTANTVQKNFSSVITYVTSAVTFDGQNLYLKEVEPSTVRCAASGCSTTLIAGEYPVCLGECFETDPFSYKSTVEWVSSSVLSGPFTFTYPSVYLAHRPIRIGRRHNSEDSVIRDAGIVALRTDDIYSEHRSYRNSEHGVNYAQRVAKGEFLPRFSPYDVQRHFERDGKTYLPYSLRSFNFGHLENPVPASVFYNARYEDC